LVRRARARRYRRLPLARLTAYLGKLARAKRYAASCAPRAGRLGGWESSEMVRRYAHFSVEHLAPYAAHCVPMKSKWATSNPSARSTLNERPS
jgi:hypothetical protein